MAARMLFFDIDDVLFPSTEFAELARRNALHAMIEIGLEADYAKLGRLLEKVIGERGSNYQNHFDAMLAEMRVPKGRRARFVAAAVGAYHDTKAAIRPYHDVPLALLRLRKKYRIYAASEGIAVKQWDKLIRMKIAMFFDDAFVSEDLGVGKGPAFYRRIAKLAGAKPGECVMVGDREDKDIIPAKKAGWLAVRVRRKGAKHAAGRTCADAEIGELGGLAKAIERLDR